MFSKKMMPVWCVQNRWMHPRSTSSFSKPQACITFIKKHRRYLLFGKCIALIARSLADWSFDKSWSVYGMVLNVTTISDCRDSFSQGVKYVFFLYRLLLCQTANLTMFQTTNLTVFQPRGTIFAIFAMIITKMTWNGGKKTTNEKGGKEEWRVRLWRLQP